MSTHKVLLVNRSIGRSVNTIAVCGHSRKTYGFSTYSDKWNAHVLALELDAYEKAIEDISRNFHRSRCRWEPHFLPAEEVAKAIITPQNNEQLRELYLKSARLLSDADVVMLAKERYFDALGAATLDQQPEPSQVVETQPANLPPAATSDGLPTQYFSVVKVANAEGVKILDDKGERIGTLALKEAILAKRAHKAA